MSAIWETRDGRRVPVSEMTDAHLGNTVRYLCRKAWKQFNVSTRCVNGDMAADAVGLHGEFVKPGPPFDDMVAECRARGGRLGEWAEEVWDQIHMAGWEALSWPERRRRYLAADPVPYPSKPGE